MRKKKCEKSSLFPKIESTSTLEAIFGSSLKVRARNTSTLGRNFQSTSTLGRNFQSTKKVRHQNPSTKKVRKQSAAKTRVRKKYGQEGCRIPKYEKSTEKVRKKVRNQPSCKTRVRKKYDWHLRVRKKYEKSTKSAKLQNQSTKKVRLRSQSTEKVRKKVRTRTSQEATRCGTHLVGTYFVLIRTFFVLSHTLRSQSYFFHTRVLQLGWFLIFPYFSSTFSYFGFQQLSWLYFFVHWFFPLDFVLQFLANVTFHSQKSNFYRFSTSIFNKRSSLRLQKIYFM